MHGIPPVVALIGCMGGATTFACKSQGCLWQDWYIYTLFFCNQSQQKFIITFSGLVHLKNSPVTREHSPFFQNCQSPKTYILLSEVVLSFQMSGYRAM